MPFPLPRLRREARIGLAALLSVVILVTILIAGKIGKKDDDEKSSPGGSRVTANANRPPKSRTRVVTQITGQGEKGSGSNNAPKGTQTQHEPSGSIAQRNSNAKGRPTTSVANGALPVLPDVIEPEPNEVPSTDPSVATAANETESETETETEDDPGLDFFDSLGQAKERTTKTEETAEETETHVAANPQEDYRVLDLPEPTPLPEEEESNEPTLTETPDPLLDDTEPTLDESEDDADSTEVAEHVEASEDAQGKTNSRLLNLPPAGSQTQETSQARGAGQGSHVIPKTSKPPGGSLTNQTGTESVQASLPAAPVEEELPSELVPQAEDNPIAEVEPTVTDATPDVYEAAPDVPDLAAPPRSPGTGDPSTPLHDAAGSGHLIALPNAGRNVILDVHTLNQPGLAASPPRTIEPETSREAPAETIRTASAVDAATEKEASGAPIQPLLHVVQRGENFFTISRLYYNTGRYYKALWKANSDQVQAPEELYVGTTIRVPPPEALDPSLVVPPRVLRTDSVARTRTGGQGQPKAPGALSDTLVMLPVGSSKLESPPSDLPPPETAPQRVYHIVKPYETLRSIARATLGDSARADEIRNLNLDILNADGSVKPGQRIRLPDDASRSPTMIR